MATSWLRVGSHPVGWTAPAALSNAVINTDGRIDFGLVALGDTTNFVSGTLLVGNGGTSATTFAGILANLSGQATADFSFNSNKITNVDDPTADQDVATKAYVDAVASGLDIHPSVRVATTVAGTLATSFENGDTIDGITLATGNRILIKDQASPIENGIYIVAVSGAPTRALDLTTGDTAAGTFVFVEDGTANADSGWVCTSNAGSDVVGTNNLTFTQFTGLGQVTAGAGLTKTGNTLDVGAGTGITVNPNDVALTIPVVGTSGGTGQTTTTTGDLLVGGAANTWNKLPAGTINYPLVSGGAGVSSSWAQLTSSGIASGTTTLPAATVGGTAWDFNDNEVTGLRPKNYTFAGLPSIAGVSVGRHVYVTDRNAFYVAI